MVPIELKSAKVVDMGDGIVSYLDIFGSETIRSTGFAHHLPNLVLRIRLLIFLLHGLPHVPMVFSPHNHSAFITLVIKSLIVYLQLGS